jgi:hypothetical protein
MREDFPSGNYELLMDGMAQAELDDLYPRPNSDFSYLSGHNFERVDQRPQRDFWRGMLVSDHDDSSAFRTVERFEFEAISNNANVATVRVK